MKINSPSLHMSALLVLAFACLVPSMAQTPEGPPPPPAKELQSPSAIMQPALNAVQQALSTVRLDKWKTSNSIRDESNTNMNSILHDIETTLPPLLAAADAAPNSVAHALPAFRNTEALYDVLLRVSEAGRFYAPHEQSTALQQSLDSLETARRAFADRLQSDAVARDQQIHTLQTTVVTLQHRPVPTPVTLPCPTPPHHATKKHETHHKPVEKKPEETKPAETGTQSPTTPPSK